MPEYPNNLPCPLLSANVKFPKTFDKTEFEHSNRYRKRYKCDINVEVKFLFDYDEMEEFMNWYRNSLDYGLMEFTASWEILPGFSNEFRFDEAFSVELVDKFYNVKAILMTKDK